MADVICFSVTPPFSAFGGKQSVFQDRQSFGEDLIRNGQRGKKADHIAIEPAGQQQQTFILCCLAHSLSKGRIRLAIIR